MLRRVFTLVAVIAMAIGVMGPASASHGSGDAYESTESGVSTITGCPLPTECTMAGEGSGWATRLGSFESTSEGTLVLFPEESCFLLDGTTEGVVWRGSGSHIFVSVADGSELHGTWENSGCLGPPGTEAIGAAIAGSQTFDGGTGRFAEAYGRAMTRGAGVGSEFTLEARGTLTR